MIRLTIPGEVVPQGRPRFARTKTGVRTYDPARSREYKSFVQWSTFQLWPEKPLDGPLSVRIVQYRAIPASWSKKRRTEALSGIIRPTGRPDLDNVVKAILDSLNGRMWRDDSQVVSLHAEKRYSETPRAEVEIEWVKEQLEKHGESPSQKST